MRVLACVLCSALAINAYFWHFYYTDCFPDSYDSGLMAGKDFGYKSDSFVGNSASHETGHADCYVEDVGNGAGRGYSIFSHTIFSKDVSSFTKPEAEITILLDIKDVESEYGVINRNLTFCSSVINTENRSLTAVFTEGWLTYVCVPFLEYSYAIYDNLGRTYQPIDNGSCILSPAIYLEWQPLSTFKLFLSVECEDLVIPRLGPLAFHNDTVKVNNYTATLPSDFTLLHCAPGVVQSNYNGRSRLSWIVDPNVEFDPQLVFLPFTTNVTDLHRWLSLSGERRKTSYELDLKEIFPQSSARAR